MRHGPSRNLNTMVRSCELKALRRCTSKEGEGVSFFNFPVKHGLVSEWCRNLLWPDDRPIPDRAVLCQFHFIPAQDFTTGSVKRRRLVRNAVPYDTVRESVEKWHYCDGIYFQVYKILIARLCCYNAAWNSTRRSV